MCGGRQIDVSSFLLHWKRTRRSLNKTSPLVFLLSSLLLFWSFNKYFNGPNIIPSFQNILYSSIFLALNLYLPIQRLVDLVPFIWVTYHHLYEGIIFPTSTSDAYWECSLWHIKCKASQPWGLYQCLSLTLTHVTSKYKACLCLVMFGLQVVWFS